MPIENGVGAYASTQFRYEIHDVGYFCAERVPFAKSRVNVESRIFINAIKVPQGVRNVRLPHGTAEPEVEAPAVPFLDDESQDSYGDCCEDEVPEPEFDHLGKK